MTIEADVSGAIEPGMEGIKLIGSVELFTNFNTCPAFTWNTTVPPVLSVKTAG